MSETETTPSWPDLLKMFVDHRLRGMLTVLGARVVSYDKIMQRATVQPTTKLPLTRKDGTVTWETPPQVPSAKVVFPAPKGVVFHYDLEVDEGVLLLVATYNLEQFLRTAEVSEPGDVRNHVLANSVVLPGLNVDADVMTDLETGFQLGVKDGPMMLFTASEVRVGSTTANKGAARNGDAVRVTIPAGTFLVSATGGALNPSPVVVDGTIQEGSSIVKIAD